MSYSECCDAPMVLEEHEGIGVCSKCHEWTEPMGCSCCGGPPEELGCLGYQAHYRCRDCGLEWSEDVYIGKDV